MKPSTSWVKLGEIIDSLSVLDWIGLVIILVLLCLLIFFVWRRKYRKDGSQATSSAMVVPEKTLLASNGLSKIWRSFVSQIPWRLRPSVLAVPVSLVIGEAGSGKTEIIDRYADWVGQNFRYHPSVVNESLLQIYKGAKALVLELSSSLLYDDDPATYRAIKKLWQCLPSNPQVVMVIDATTLLKPDPERLRLSAQALSGKLKVFNGLEGKSLPLTITLSHMEKIKGFVEFCVFLENENIPLQIEFSEGDGIYHIEYCLESYKQHLNRALVNCSSQDYLKIATFLDELPRFFGVLSEFLHLIGLKEERNSFPVIRLCLLSKEVKSFGCRPFALQPNFIEKTPFELEDHAKAALIILFLGFMYLGGSYYSQKHLIQGVMEKIKTVSTTPINQYPEKISPLFTDFSADLNKNPLLTFQPKFFSEMSDYSNHLLIREIRKYYLIPMLEKAQFETDSIYKSIKLLAILYAKPDNEMGNLVLRQLQDKPTDYMVKYRLLLQEYIKNNSHLEELNRPLNGLDYTLSKSYGDVYELLLLTFNEYDLILENQFIDESAIDLISQDTSKLLKFMDELNSHSHENMMMKWLIENTGLEIDLESYSMQQNELRQKPMQNLLRLLSRINDQTKENCPEKLSIHLCIKKIQEIYKSKINTENITMKFTLAGDGFLYETKNFNDLIQQHHLVMALRNSMLNHKSKGWIFFNKDYSYPDVEMNATNAGDMLFSGKSFIDGRLTAEAFEQDVKPVILELSSVIAKLPIKENEKRRFTKYILKNLNTYSSLYVKSYYNYFQSLNVRIDSEWEFNYILEQVQQPYSPLLDALELIKENTELDLSGSQQFNTFKNQISVFNFVRKLMKEKDGFYPEFQKYQLIISQMHAELSSKDPYKEENPDDEAALLKGTITPMGRVAWGMLFNEDSSYLKQVRNWLLNAGIPKNWQQPFLAPVLKASTLGAAEIKMAIHSIWLDMWYSNITPLFVKFPFTLSAGQDKELLFEDLHKILHPKQGVFWQTFNKYLAPLYHYNNKNWMERQELHGKLELPKNILKRVNAAQQLTNHLWDNNGVPKPFKILVKPGLLPFYNMKQIPNAPLVSLNYLREGGSSVLGFNQQVVWQTLALEWWMPQLAEVGMKFLKNDDDLDHIFTNISVTNSQWNFFRLLQKGESTGNNHYRWLLAHPELPKQPLSIEFSFKSAPWGLFTNLSGS